MASSQEKEVKKDRSVSTSTSSSSSHSFILWIVYINVILYALCFQLQKPIEPFLIEKLNVKESKADDEYARLQSFFSIMQMIGSLIVGILLDTFGIRGGFLVSFSASALSYFLLSISTNMNILYISKIPTVFQAGFLCSQATVSAITENGSKRTSALGRLTLAYTIGSIIGPALGGYLGAGDYYVGARLAVAGSILSIILTFMIPNRITSAPSITAADSPKEKTKEGSQSHFIFAILKKVWLILLIKLISSTANAIASSALPLILKNHYGFNEKAMGFTMSTFSAANSIVNGFLLNPIVSLCKNDLVSLTKYCLLIMFTLYVFQTVFSLFSILEELIPKFVPFLATSIVLSMVQYVLSTSLTSESTSRVNENEKGSLLGLEHSLFAAARIVTPQMGVYLLHASGITGTSAVCGSIFLLSSSIWIFLEYPRRLHTEKQA